jgi:hypothetical protein
VSDYSPGDFRPGQRVESHPATVLWLSGVRYGTVTKIGTKFVHVRFDRGRPGHDTVAMHPSNILPADD